MSDISGTLTICRRAGKLITGMDEVKSACRSGKAFGVLLASDLSPKSRKEILFVCESENIPAYDIDMTMNDVGAALGKVFGIIAVADRGFMKSIEKRLAASGNKPTV